MNWIAKGDTIIFSLEFDYKLDISLISKYSKLIFSDHTLNYILFEKYKLNDYTTFFLCENNFENKENVINELINLAVLLYCESLEGIKYIPSFRARLCVKLMIAVYGSILGRIILDKSVVFKKRVVISHFKKLIIFMKILFGFHPLKVANLINEKEML